MADPTDGPARSKAGKWVARILVWLATAVCLFSAAREALRIHRIHEQLAARYYALPATLGEHRVRVERPPESPGFRLWLVSSTNPDETAPQGVKGLSEIPWSIEAPPEKTHLHHEQCGHSVVVCREVAEVAPHRVPELWIRYVVTPENAEFLEGVKLAVACPDFHAGDRSIGLYLGYRRGGVWLAALAACVLLVIVIR